MTRRVIGSHELGAPLGALGCGMALHAVHVATGEARLVVILSPSLAADSSVLEGLQREADQTAARQDQGIATILETGTEGDLTYAVVNVQGGQTMRDFLAASGVLAPDRGLALLEQLATTLDRAHDGGTSHWALSPRSLVIDADDRITLVDLGLARVLETSARLALFGRGYEQAARILDGRAADLYALGLLSRELLTGRTPDRSADPAATAIWSDRALAVETVLEEHLADPLRPGYGSAGALATALRQAIDRVIERRREDARRRASARAASPKSSAEQQADPALFYERPTPRPGAPDALTVQSAEPEAQPTPPDGPAGAPPSSESSSPTVLVQLSAAQQAALNALSQEARARRSRPILLWVAAALVGLAILVSVGSMLLKPAAEAPAELQPTPAVSTGGNANLLAPPPEATVPPLPRGAGTVEAVGTPAAGATLQPGQPPPATP